MRKEVNLCAFRKGSQNDGFRKISKKGQITIFVIIAIILVAVIILFFLLSGNKVSNISISPALEFQPYQFIESCVKEATEQAIAIMLPQGGLLNPENYILYSNNKVEYICYNKNYYDSCVMQYPAFRETLERQIHEYIEPRVEACFATLKDELEKRNNDVELGRMEIDVFIVPKIVEITIDRDLRITKNQETREFDKFKIGLQSPLYDFGAIAQEIANQEARFCNFENIGYGLFYNDFEIRRLSVGHDLTASRIYTIRDKISDKILYTAVRSCAIPPGF